MKSVDVVVPCYNYGSFLSECVTSVLTQAAVDVRVLILDDQSSDNSEEVGSELAAKDKRVTFLRHVRNRGHIATYNEGIEWASAEFFLLLSADDYLLPGAFQRSTSLMTAHPDIGFVFGKFIQTEAGRPPIYVNPCARWGNDVGDRVMTGRQFIERTYGENPVSTPTAMVRTQLQKALGGYRAELPHSADMELWLRLAAHGSVGFVNDYQAVYRRHSTNMSIAYNVDRMLPDLRARKAAFDLFLESCAARFKDADQIKARFERALGVQSVGEASAAFNTGDLKAVERLLSFATEVSPGVTRSWPWLKLAGKQLLGVTASNALRSIRSGPSPS